MATPRGLWIYTFSKDEVLGKEFHPQAAKLFSKHSQAFAYSLQVQSQLIADKNKAEIVLSSHVEEALKKLRPSGSKFWPRELVMLIGSAFFGAFVPGFVNELSNGNTVLIAIYTILGFTGMLMVTWAIRD